MTGRYQKAGGVADMRGEWFEVKLAALLLLRALRSGQRFQLAANAAGAGALDDLVFKFPSLSNGDSWHCCFVQLKHKQSAQLAMRMLTAADGKFALKRYFASYCKIREAMTGEERSTLFRGGDPDNCSFVIYTNARAGFEPTEKRTRDSGRVEWFLGSGAPHERIFGFHKTRDAEVYAGMQEHGEEGARFLRQVAVFSGQPGEHELDALVKVELVAASGCTKAEADLLYRFYEEEVKLWWRDSNVILDQSTDLLSNALKRLAVETLTPREERRFRLDICFRESALLGLRSALLAARTLLVVSSTEPSSRLTATKLLQAAIALDAVPLAVDAASFSRDRSAAMAAWTSGKRDPLVVVLAKGDATVHCPLLKDLCDTASSGTEKRVVFLAPDVDQLVPWLSEKMAESVARWDDTFELSQLNEESVVQLLATPVSLQGEACQLGSLLGDDPSSVLDAPRLLDVISGPVPLSVGVGLEPGIGFYVTRALEWRNLVDGDILRVPDLHDPITVRYANPGDLQDALFEGETSMGALQLIHWLRGAAVCELVDPEFRASSSSVQQLAIGHFNCCPVGLRIGQITQVTALRVRSCKDTTNQRLLLSSFLFVSRDVSDDDATELSALHRSVHELRQADRELRWSCSKRHIDVIQPWVRDACAEKMRPNTPFDVNSRLVLLCAEPGMGKSTLAIRLAIQTKRERSHCWVISIALNDHTPLFANGRHRNAVDFLLAAVSPGMTPLATTLLRLALEVTGDVVVLLDGFDEIAPKYSVECCDFLSSLLDTKASRVWVTSRHSMKDTLEAHLATLAVRLLKFDESDQRRFFKLFWAGKATLPENELDVFITRLLEMMSRTISDREKDFTGIPLQTQMMAEVFQEHVDGSTETPRALPERLDLLLLFQYFVEKKLFIFYQEKLKIKATHTEFEDLVAEKRASFFKNHMRAALVLLLGDDELAALHSANVAAKSREFLEAIRSGKDKTGIVDRLVNDKPHFVHRVFAEFFAAQWTAKHYAKNKALVENTLFTANFGVVRNIFDRILAKDCELHTAVLSADVEIVKMLLERGSDANARDQGGRTSLHLAAAFGISEDQSENDRNLQILDQLIKYTTDYNLEDKVLHGSPLRYADIIRWWDVIDKLLAFDVETKHLVTTGANLDDPLMWESVIAHDLDRLTAYCLDHGLAATGTVPSLDSLLPDVAERGSLRVTSLLVDRGADLEATRWRDASPMHLAAAKGHLAIVELLAGSISSKGDLKIHLDSCRDVDGLTALHLASREGHDDVVRLLLDLGATVTCVTLERMTPLHLAAREGHVAAARMLVDQCCLAGKKGG